MYSPRTCAICGGSFAQRDAVVYLRSEDVLMHRRCCHRHPSCHCEEWSRLARVPSRTAGAKPEPKHGTTA